MRYLQCVQLNKRLKQKRVARFIYFPWAQPYLPSNISGRLFRKGLGRLRGSEVFLGKRYIGYYTRSKTRNSCEDLVREKKHLFFIEICAHVISGLVPWEPVEKCRQTKIGEEKAAVRSCIKDGRFLSTLKKIADICSV